FNSLNASLCWFPALSWWRTLPKRSPPMNVFGKFIWEQVMTDLLCMQGIEAGYGDAIVLEDINFSLRDGETLAVLGRNGVGKTTLIATSMGHTRIRRGEMSWLDKNLRKATPHSRARMGLGWVPQEREVFPSLSVEENLAVAALPGP